MRKKSKPTLLRSAASIAIILGILASPFVFLGVSLHAESESSSSSLHKALRKPLNNHDNKLTNDDFKLAHDQSFGFFNDIPSAQWERLKNIYLQHENHRDMNRPLLYSPHDPFAKAEWYNSPRAWYQNNYEPNFSCRFEKRVGVPMNGDGPKWVCDPHRIKELATERKAKDPNHPGCVVYSIGSRGEFNFELGMQKEVGVGTCEYHIFDMGIGKVPNELKRATYHQWGLKKQQDNLGVTNAIPSSPRSKQYYGLRDTVNKLGHQNLDVIDIFKIDCEDCEWETYMDWFADGIPLLQQIQVEVHRTPKNVTNFFDSLEAAGYLRFHKEPNIQFGPDCAEYSMLKVDKDFMKGKMDKK